MSRCESGQEVSGACVIGLLKDYRHLSERLSGAAPSIAAHHGSLAREYRLCAEARLKEGSLRALVATASLELGIDVGEVDLCCQIGSPRSIATLLQRVGRSGHAIAGLPKGRLFPLSRDDATALTVGDLRIEIEPVSGADFMRFLFAWQHVSADSRLSGEAALPAVLERLMCFEAPARPWEADLLPARLSDYDPNWLDRFFLSGQGVWRRRLRDAPGEGAAATLRMTPVTLLRRQDLMAWEAITTSPEPAPLLSPAAEATRGALGSGGAVFFDDLLARLRLLPSQLEAALSELAGQGLAACDGFVGLRGGRFLTLCSGEQFALPEAVGLLREIGSQSGREVHMSEDLDRSAAWEARKTLLRRGIGASRFSVAADGTTTP